MAQDEQKHETGEAGLDGRYSSSVGYEPRDKWSERELAAAAKKAREEYRVRRALETAIEVRPANEWLDEAPEPRKKAELFGPFWRQGELAVLVGASGVGKSVMAIQVAEASSAMDSGQLTMENGGEFSELSTVDCPLTILFDLERTGRQLRERYSDGRRRYEFPERLDMGLLGDVETPAAYKGRRERFLRDAVLGQLVEKDPRVAIVDNVSWMTRSQSATEMRALMKTFRRWVNDTGNSLLLLMHATETEEALIARKGLELADTIVSMRQSTMGRAFRYLKLVHSPNGGPQENVWGYELVRSPAPKPLTSVTDVRHTLNDAPTPFLGFLHLGEGPEELHTFDYKAQREISRQAVARAEERFRHRARLTPVRVPQLDAVRPMKKLSTATTLLDVAEGHSTP